MTFSFPNTTEIVNNGFKTLKRFPLALLSSFLTTAIAFYFIVYEPEDIKGFTLTLAKLATTATLAVFIFTSLKLLEHNTARYQYWLVLGLAILGLIGYYLSLPDDMYDFGALLYVFRHIFLMILFFITILWVPFLQTNISNEDYWAYVKGIILALLMTLNFTIVIVLGVNAALYAVEELFGLYIKGKYYFGVNIFILGVFSVGYFLSQIPKKPLNIKAILPPPGVEKFFTQYVLTPLAGLYFIILYAYTAKVLVSMDLPKGILAWLIVAFSVVLVITYLFWTHFTSGEPKKWRRWIWLAVLLQTGMLFVAIGIRILEYSWTENRYMVLLLGVWLAGISLYFLLKKEAKIKWIFISLSLLIAFSQIGPFSAYSVSKKAQTKRLETNLKVFHKDLDPKKVPARVRYEISDVTQYLYNRYGIKALEPIFPKITADFIVLDGKLKAAQKELQKKRELERKKNNFIATAGKEEYRKIQDIFKDKPQFFPYFVTDALGFRFMNSWDYNNERNGTIQNINFQVRYSSTRGMMAEDIRGYDYVSNYHGNSYENVKKGSIQPLFHLENIGVTITFEKAMLKLNKDNEVIVIDMKAYIKELVEKHGISPRNITKKELTLEKENDILKVRIEFQHLNKNNYRHKNSINFNARILFKLKGEK